MGNVMLIMHRKAVVPSLVEKLQNGPDVDLIYETDYGNANNAIIISDAKVAIIEVAESGYYDIAYCLTLCRKLRIETPDCKLLLMCSDQDENTIKQVIEAKIENIIDDFVFYDVTIDYLVSKLTSLQ